MNRLGSAKLVAKVLTDKQPQLHERRLTSDFSYFASVMEELDASAVEDEGGVSDSVIQDLKNAFGTDFHVDSALIDAILRRNCIAFVGAGFSQGEIKLTWDELVEKLVVMNEQAAHDGLLKSEGKGPEAEDAAVLRLRRAKCMLLIFSFDIYHRSCFEIAFCRFPRLVT